ncbi:hypothetical protein FRX31_023058 [Thalictrum thalictroides]|uniref:Replication protein A 70 kDa DNA-binding subunit B/D first OB fold domain-containing protein n=1 Tax=Thalictrum thalictroides TaxID=46969 RepID=A0A7J6VT05_THATH|nr:hypothetical protein FRX31_023058 [Thalictrum thalictroides]
MAGRNLSLINELKNGYVQWTIKVRVFKFWEGAKNGVPTGLDYIFVDEKGNRIHGMVLKSNKCKFNGILEEQKIYILTNISVFKPELKYRPTRHDFMAVLNANTAVQEVTELSDFPRYSFDFIKLNTLAQHNNNDFLNDVIGIFIGSSEVQTVRNNKIIQIWLQDET